MMRHVPPAQMVRSSTNIAGPGRGTPQTAQPATNPNRRLILLCVMLIGAIIAGTVVLLSYTRKRALIDTQRELANMALILAAQTSRTLEAIDLVEDSVAVHVRALGITSPKEFDARMATSNVHAMLRDKISGLPFVDTLTVIGTDGIMVNTAQEGPIPKTNISDRPHFRTAASRSGPYLSVPVISRTTGDWTIYLIRRIEADDGTIVGFVLGAITLDNLEKFFATITLSQESSISLVRSDGVLLVRYPQVESTIGQDLSRRPDVRAVLQSSISSLISIGRIDGRDRLFAGHWLDRFQVATVVTTTVRDALADWSLLATFAAAVATLAIVAIGVMFRLILRELRQRQASAQRRLDSQQIQLDAALNNMSQGLCMFDADARLVVCNDRYIEMYGLSREIVVPGISLRNILRHRKDRGLLSDDPEEYFDRVRTSVVNRGIRPLFLRLDNGRTIAVVNRAMADGGWVATHEDITERREVELERDRNREFLDRVIENIPVSIFVKSAVDKRYILMNRAGEQMLGISRQDALGRVAGDFMEKTTAEEIAKDDEALLRAETDLFIDEHQVRTLAGEARYVTARRMCIRSSEGAPQFLLTVVEDMTERRVARQQLVQAQRMEAVARLTGGLAHDFNNLLMIIIGNLDLLAEEVSHLPSAAKKVETVLQAGLRGSDLTGRLLAFSRRQSLLPKRLQTNGLIRNLTKLLQRTLGTDVTIELNLCDDLWPVAADESQLEAALINLAINARDAMPGGGKLIIATRNVVLDAAYCALVPGVKPGEFVAIEATDTGTGMPPEVLARVFEPFFTTKTADRGTGLGLSSVFGFIRQSGGHIDARSEVGAGTTFILYLPRTEAVPQLSEGVPAAAPKFNARASDAVILVVEDDPVIRAMVTGQLGALGYRVVAAENAADALKTLETHHVDLLFTDMVMPGEMNGKQLASVARARYPAIKTLFTSGFPGESEMAGAKLEVDDVLLKKPYRKNELISAVRDALEGDHA